MPILSTDYGNVRHTERLLDDGEASTMKQVYRFALQLHFESLRDLINVLLFHL